MSSIIPSQILSGQSVSRIRKSGGFNDPAQGNAWVEGTPTTTPDIPASVQMPSRTGSKKRLQETYGERAEDLIVVWVQENTFQVADDRLGQESDIIVFEGQNYEIDRINKWRGQALTHDQVFAIRTQESP